jgi:hypothetical protein
MPPHRKRSALRWVAATLAALVLVGGAIAVADPDESHRPGAASGPAAAQGPGSAVVPAPSLPIAANYGGRACAGATAATIEAIDAHVAHRIYDGERSGRAVEVDLSRIAHFAGLASAVASGNRAAVYAVVHKIVYTPHWHIVRLRVSRGGHVLADVGGPYVIAPVTGTLRQGGRPVGTFAMAAQDDVGYVKLVTRFTGVPIDLYGTPHPPRSFLLGTLRPAPPLPADGASLSTGGTSFLAHVSEAAAFPQGKLHVVLFVPAPQSLAKRSCATVRASAWLSVLEHLAARFVPLSAEYQDYVGTLKGATGGLTFVREGNRQIAGLSAGPARLPLQGTVRYRGRRWQVVTWEPYPPARVYFLAPS